MPTKSLPRYSLPTSIAWAKRFAAVERAGVDLLHFDVMDGHFVPNISMGVPILQAIRKVTKLPLDAHLMISEPEKYVEVFVKSGANSVSVHCEVCPDIPKMAKRIRDLGARASIGINPETPIDRVIAAAEHLDMILIMSVHPGFGGQHFIPESLQKLREVRRELKRRGLSLDVEIDGGVKADNIADVKAAGANVFVSGSGIFGEKDYSKIVADMRDLIANAKPTISRPRDFLLMHCRERAHRERSRACRGRSVLASCVGVGVRVGRRTTSAATRQVHPIRSGGVVSDVDLASDCAVAIGHEAHADECTARSAASIAGQLLVMGKRRDCSTRYY